MIKLIPYTPNTQKWQAVASLPAPTWMDIKIFCEDYCVSSLWLRPSRRSFTGWVAVVAFDIADFDPQAAIKSAKRVEQNASDFFYAGAYCALRITTTQVKVSLPCLPPDAFAFAVREKRLKRKRHKR
ncbi:hypothetical protein F7734_53395 [Scytonema sp. UIC 10036]|uniref:hypothetical protein n=1 Tax=Scytonema sp. UIC 10036 TaxID=2304196 RepID=UPI0012DA32ED|nr:hypothetical protein [Scytonema sp. UIC 10036]MUH00605.1 hypothetical protein [Scytonema sp. UIC 10036]